MLAQDPAEGRDAAAGRRRCRSSSPRRAPDGAGRDTGNPTVEDATKTLEDAGYKVKTTERQDPDPALAGRVIGQSPGGRDPRSTGGTVTIAVVPARPDADPSRRHPDADRCTPVAMRVAVLAGGRSSEHDVSLNSAAVGPRGRGRGRPRGARRDDRAHRRLDLRRRGAGAAARQAGCSAPTSCSRSCTARSARTGRSRACWSCWTCPTSARACSRPRCAWTRWSSRRCWPPPTSRRCPTRASARRAGGPSPRPSCASWPCSASPSSSSPRGWAPRSGSPRCGRRPSSARRWTPPSPTTRW